MVFFIDIERRKIQLINNLKSPQNTSICRVIVTKHDSPVRKTASGLMKQNTVKEFTFVFMVKQFPIRMPFPTIQ